MNNAPVSALHKKTGEYLRSTYPDAKVEGWPGSEANLGHMLGLKEMNLRLDFLVTLDDGRSFAVEVQSNLHDSRGEKAWNAGRDEHLKRMERDKTKRGLCAELGLPVAYVWNEQDFGSVIEDTELMACVINRKDNKEKPKRSRIETSGSSWAPREMKSDQKMQSGSSFGTGRKMGGGSSFGKGKRFG